MSFPGCGRLLSAFQIFSLFAVLGTLSETRASAVWLPSHKALHKPEGRAQSKLIVQEPPRIPGDLHGMVAEADVVLYAVVEDSTPVQPAQRGESVVPVRLHAVRPIETIKAAVGLKAITRFVVVQPGGTIDWKGREVSVAIEGDTLKPGDVVVLFLRKRSTDGASGTFDVAFGPAGIIPVTLQDGLRIALLPPAVRRSPDLSGKPAVPVDQLLSALRARK